MTVAQENRRASLDVDAQKQIELKRMIDDQERQRKLQQLQQNMDPNWREKRETEWVPPSMRHDGLLEEIDRRVLICPSLS